MNPLTTYPTINGETMPAWFFQRWDSAIRWIPPRSFAEGRSRNGQGELYISGLFAVEWSWSKVNDSWWRWWTATILSGNWSVTCNVTIWGPDGISDDTLVTYNNVIVYHPLWGRSEQEHSSRHFQDVRVRIAGIPLSSFPTTTYWTVSLTEVGSTDVISS